MAKTVVVGPDRAETKIPFLRGILIRSLQDAGLSFDNAYELASAIRDELSDTAEITTDKLHDRVLRHLSKDFSDAVVQRYSTPTAIARMVLVRNSEGLTTPFSREEHRRRLESSGLASEDATAVTVKIFDHLMKRGAPEISARHLGLLTHRYLRWRVGADAARRYMVLVEFLRGRRPLLLLIGGAPGCGKSALATEVAHQLEIARTQSTDLLREVMRVMIPERLMPVLHTSSFNAWGALPGSTDRKKVPDNLLVDGYRAQAELLSLPCEAVIRRSLREQTSLILEGVHIQHTVLASRFEDSGAVVVPILLAIVNPERLRERFVRRGDLAAQRRAERYLQNFDAIWRLQSFLLSEADRSGVPIISNNNMERAVRVVMKTIIDHLAVGFTAKPLEVFV